MNPVDTLNTISKSLAAISFNTLAIITSFQEQAEWWLRVTSLLVSVAVGILTIFWLLRRLRSGDGGGD